VSNRRRLTTDDQRQWLARAKEYGGLCAACGRTLDDGETVYLEPVEVELKVSSSWSRRTANRDAPLGAECAARDFVERAARSVIDPCEECGRPVFYAIERTVRAHTFCSKRCRGLTQTKAR
jgi:hypothetical protein